MACIQSSRRQNHGAGIGPLQFSPKNKIIIIIISQHLITLVNTHCNITLLDITPIAFNTCSSIYIYIYIKLSGLRTRTKVSKDEYRPLRRLNQDRPIYSPLQERVLEISLFKMNLNMLLKKFDIQK